MKAVAGLIMLVLALAAISGGHAQLLLLLCIATAFGILLTALTR